ncbi:MAG: hypothetical protein HDT30_11135 [Clostridiales bacterium]|nr:hypothetical protein [Clostridiales bacterium]
MKKVVKHITIIMLVCILTVTGCGRSSSVDSFVEETDYQYQYVYGGGMGGYIARAKDTMYFKIGSYIYQMDEQTKILMPLCNKPNCLHDKETDDERIEECYAYFIENHGTSASGPEGAGFAYMNGYIYYVTEKWEDGEPHSYSILYKIAKDGSQREKVYQWDGLIYNWVMHRNVMYYIEHTFDESGKEEYAVKEMNLAGVGKLKPEIFYKPDPEEKITSVSYSGVYGNHLYMEEFVGGYEECTIKTLQYNLQDKTLTEIQIPNQSDTEYVSCVTFWKNRIVYHVFDMEKDGQYDATEDVYIADLDGTNAEILLKDIPMYYQFYSDGNYLYVSNCRECEIKIYDSLEYQNNMNNLENMKWDFKLHVDVYNQDMELVDSVEPPFHDFPYEPDYGIGDRVYVKIEDESGDGVSIQYWDKTKIGTYHGDEYKLTKLCDQTYSYLDKKIRKNEYLRKK